MERSAHLRRAARREDGSFLRKATARPSATVLAAASGACRVFAA